MRGGVELIREVFGSDSDSDDADELNHPGPSPPAPLMRPGCVVETPLGADACVGLFVAREALGEDARRWLLDSIRADDLVDFPDDEPSTAGASAASDRCAPTGGARNQAMRFGRDHLPRWALALADAVAKLATTRPGFSKGVSPTASASAAAADDDDDDAIFPREVLARALMPSGVFNQMIVNQYKPGEGLAPHVDLHAFADGVAVVSLRSTVVMDMYPPGEGSSCCSSTPVWLRPGDVMFLSRAARWEWAHGIAARVADPAEGETGPEGASWVRRGCRTSVTLRAMREDGHELRVPA